jgi:2'-5' RNA ligase
MREPLRAAIDVAILVPEVVGASARDINAVLARGREKPLRLDATHLPHLTLAQQFVERRRLDDLYTELDRVLRHEPVLRLRVSGIAVEDGTVMFTVDCVPDLQRVHELVMETLQPFEAPEGASDAFARNGETIRPGDIDWVRSYRERSAYTHYRPHVTLGHGPVPPAAAPIEFCGETVAVCHLGRFCTCRAILRAWTLGSRHS